MILLRTPVLFFSSLLQVRTPLSKLLLQRLLIRPLHRMRQRTSLTLPRPDFTSICASIDDFVETLTFEPSRNEAALGRPRDSVHPTQILRPRWVRLEFVLENVGRRLIRR